ncbi:MAG: hypothetical protein Q9223_003978 [Gallowayella weberi]
MTKYTFHLTPHASTPLYRFISSPILRLIQLFLTLLAILFFSVGDGLAEKYIGTQYYGDLGVTSDFCEKFALGWMSLHIIWLVFLLLWYVMKKPKLHPGYYIGIDLYLGISAATAMAVMVAFSYIVDGTGWGFDNTDCKEPPEWCARHFTAIRGVDTAAYAFACLVAYVLSFAFPIRVILGSMLMSSSSLMHLVYFCVACRVCTLYDREKKEIDEPQKCNFHSTPHASTRKYRFISSFKFRLVHFLLTFLSILFFAVGTGLSSVYVHGENTEYLEEVSLGIMFMSVTWLGFLLLWHILKKPSLHPGLYIGLDLYVGGSVLIAMICGVVGSKVFLEYPCDGWGVDTRCEQFIWSIFYVDIAAYAFGFLAAEQRRNKKLQKKAMQLGSPNLSMSVEHKV